MVYWSEELHFMSIRCLSATVPSKLPYRANELLQNAYLQSYLQNYLMLNDNSRVNPFAELLPILVVSICMNCHISQQPKPKQSIFRCTYKRDHMHQMNQELSQTYPFSAPKGGERERIKVKDKCPQKLGVWQSVTFARFF